MKIVLTGASGLLGRALHRELNEEHEVVGLANRHAEGGLQALDLRDAEAVDALCRRETPDVLIHSAAYRDPDYCEEHPEETRALNVAPVRTFLESLPESTRVVFISSDYVFDGRRPPYAETDERNPVNVYGASKVEAEDLLQGRGRTIIVRIPLLIGAGASWAESGFVAESIDRIRSGEPFSADDVGIRYPTWTEDVAAAVRFLLEGELDGTFHVSGERGGTKYQWVCELAELIGASADAVRPLDRPPPTKAPRPENTLLDTEKIRSCGFTRSTDVRDAAQAILDRFA